MVRILIAAGIALYALYYLMGNSGMNDEVKVHERADHEAAKVQKILDQRTGDLKKKLDQQLDQ